MLAREIKDELIPIDDNGFSRPQVVISGYNLLMMEGRNITEHANKGRRTTFTSIGIVIPFQPSMWDENEIKAVWENTIKILKDKMNRKFTSDVISRLLYRLKKLFEKLNFNTHRKSLAIILTPDKERLIYLDFPVNPVLFFAKSISALDLAANIQQEICFFYLVLGKSNAELYECDGSGHFQKVYGENDKPDFLSLSQNVIRVIEQLNREAGKPVFVTGNINQVELFCDSHAEARTYYPLRFDISPGNKEKYQSEVDGIITHWNFWRSKFISNKIQVAQQRSRIVSNVESVWKALGKGMDGLLLLDKKFKRQLQKPAPGNGIFEVAKHLNSQIEEFLARGNQIEITEPGLLSGLGGIALLTH